VGVNVGVVVESERVPAWVAWTVAQIASMDACRLAAVAVAPGPDCPHGSAPVRSARALTYRLFERLDERLFGPAGAVRSTHLPATAVDLMAKGGADSVDVVVSFLPRGRTAWDGPPPRLGVWAIAPMDDGRPGSAPGRFWDVRGRRDTAATAVVVMQDGRTNVLATCATPVDPLSLTRTRNAAAWASGRLVVRTLRSVVELDEPVPRGDDLAEGQDAPATGAILAHALRTAWRGLGAKSRAVSSRGEWFVAVRARAAGGRAPPVALANPRGRYLADPFPFERDGRHYLFVEDFSFSDARAAISVCEIGAGGAAGPLRRVLDRPHHLSYPFVFEHEGCVYMLPETGEAGRVELYRAVRFPDRWALDRVLLEGLLWLFVCVVGAPEDVGELRLYSSRSLDADWVPHPRNPVVSDAGTARPAGRLFMRGGALIRPGQDCSRTYGEAVVLNRVDVLSPTEYRETPVARIEPNWMDGLERTHTYTFDSRYECFDGYRRVRRLRFGARPATSGGSRGSSAMT
jgi:hypothetical protein